MKKITYLIYCILMLSACTIQRNIIEKEVISRKGLFVDIPHIESYYFINCKEILDTNEILVNIKIDNNIDTGLFLYNTNPVIDFILKNRNLMGKYPMKNGNTLNAILVELTYSKVITNYVDMQPTTCDLPLSDTVVSFILDPKFYKIHKIEILSDKNNLGAQKK